jgi:hypothetical protein
MLSISPPGGKGTTNLMGRAGQFCAQAGAAQKAAVMTQAAAAAIQFLRCMKVSRLKLIRSSYKF